MAFKKVEIGPKEVGDYWKPEEKGDMIEGNIYEFAESTFNDKKQVRINLYLGEDENDEAIMTLLPAHAHLKRYYVNLEKGDYIRVTVSEKIEPSGNNQYPIFKYDVEVDPDRKVEWPDDDSSYDTEVVMDDDYYAEE